jgi:hypothetical protein
MECTRKISYLVTPACAGNDGKAYFTDEKVVGCRIVLVIDATI